VISRRSRALSAVTAGASDALLLAARLLRGENIDDHRLNGERRLLRAIAREAAPGAVIFDVGANVGRWSTEAARLLPNASVHAFEPHPEAFADLRESVEGLGIECHRLAFGSRSGSAALHFDPELTVMSSLHERDLGPQGALGSTVEVEVERLDDYCDAQGIDRVDVLKIDVEGHERDVLAGAERRLAAGAIGLVQFEYGGTYLDAGVRLRDVLGLFPDSYSVFRIVPWGLAPVREADLRAESFALSNYAAIGAQWAPSALA
jgi:FkbM family methyltransferase